MLHLMYSVQVYVWRLGRGPMFQGNSHVLWSQVGLRRVSLLLLLDNEGLFLIYIDFPVNRIMVIKFIWNAHTIHEFMACGLKELLIRFLCHCGNLYDFWHVGIWPIDGEQSKGLFVKKGFRLWIAIYGVEKRKRVGNISGTQLSIFVEGLLPFSYRL